MSRLHVALVQSDIHWENSAANRKKYHQLLLNHTDNADLYVLPEMFSTGFSMNTTDYSEEMDGPTIRWMQDLSREKKAAICGSLIIHESGLFYNRFVFISDGQILGQYDKRHCFGLAEENKYFAAGKHSTILEFKGFKIRPLICYDLRFPVWSRNIKSEPYDILLYVACWPERRAHHWRSLLPARAIENQCYVIACNRVGVDGKQISYCGDSMVIDALGQTLVSAHSKDEILSTQLDLESLQKIRLQLPFLRDADNFDLAQ